MRIDVSRIIHVSKTKVFEWCTNFQETDAQYSHVRLRTRKVLERTPERVLMEETGVMMLPFKARFEVRLHYPDGWQANAESTLGTAHNEYRLTDVPEGTRLDMDFSICLKGVLKPFSIIMKPYVRSRIEEEWGDYVRAMENEIVRVVDR
jgi:hypothetical protein